MSHCPQRVTVESLRIVAGSDNVCNVYFADSKVCDFSREESAAGGGSIHNPSRQCEICSKALTGRQQIACSRRCSSVRSARISHAKHSQAGAANHNFKGWRSRHPILYTKPFKLAHPDIARAHRLVAQAVRVGLLVRPERCDSCLEKKRVDAHHPDYAAPLSVEWLCRRCHRAADIIAARARDEAGKGRQSHG